MGNSNEGSMTFSDFPEDVQVCILSFLSPSDISSFASTSKRFDALCREDGDRLWYSMCNRRWGSKTQINKWGEGKIGFKYLFKALSEYEDLIGFWRRSGGISREEVAPLVFFEWGESSVVGSRISPSSSSSNGGCSYDVVKTPFIWLTLSRNGRPLNHLKTSDSGSGSGSGSDSVQVNVSFLGKCHVVLEENVNWGGSPNRGSPPNGSFDNGGVASPEGSPPDRMTLEMYQHFANRTSPGASGERAWRRQRRREKERQLRRKWEPEHLVKIVHCSPSPSRPLQGLWKGICDDESLDFYLVAYDDIGGVSCRRVGDSVKPFSGYAPVFWTSNATFVECPLSHEEDYLYHTRVHLRPTSVAEDDFIGYSPSRIMYINSSYDLVIPDLAGTSNPRIVEGRVWQYVDGTFGFGFLRDNFIVDLKHIAQDGRVLDTAELCSG